MNNRIVVAATMGVALFVASVPALAHHSSAAEYDRGKPVKLEGTVTKIEWLNPHIWMYLDVKDDAGKSVAWQCEGGAPNMLERRGWSRHSVNAGDKIMIEGFRAKDASNTCTARTVSTADGKRLFNDSERDQ